MGKTTLFLLLLLFAGSARAGELLRWRAALTGGMLSEKHFAGVSNPGVAAAGAELGRAFGNILEFGYSFAYAGLVQKQRLTAVQTGYNVTFNILFADFLQDTTVHGFYAGPQLGIVSRSLRRSGQNAGLNSLAYGVRAGFNHPVGSGLFSLGFQVQYLSVGDAKVTITENSVNTTYRAPKTGFAKYLLLVNYKFGPAS